MSPAVATAVLCIAVAGVGAQWVAWRFKLPAIVLLFATGLVVGPGLQILQPVTDFGPGLRPIVGLAVAIVVFEGGLALDFRELRAAGEGVWRLTAVALPISFVLASFAATLVGGMGWRPAILFGAITVVTGPTVVLPLLRNTRLERRTASFLKWEAIVNDPVGALLAALVLALMLAPKGLTPAGLAGEVALSLVVATALGVGAAWLVRWLVTHDQVPETLKTPILLALAMGVYVVANLVMDEAGLAAATIFGIALANMHIPGVAEMARFKESLVVLIVSALFVVLTAGLSRAIFAQLDWSILFLTLAMVFLVRPAAILLATARSGLTWQERTLAGWIAPRGIVAAAVAGVASAKLGAAGVAGGDEVMPAVFALIAATMVLHGFSLKPVARRLGLTLGERPGLAILGAVPWTIDLAEALAKGGTPVLMIDAYAGALEEARARAPRTPRSDQGRGGNFQREFFLLSLSPPWRSWRLGGSTSPLEARGARVCRRITREHARTFYFASACLPRPTRAHAYAVYGFCRWADDGVDSARDRAEAARRLDHARDVLDLAYGSGPAPPGLLAFRRTVRARSIPRELFEDLLDGMAMDLDLARYPDFASLDLYCYRVAGWSG